MYFQASLMYMDCKKISSNKFRALANGFSWQLI